MRLLFRKFKGLGFILWQARHMFYHLLLGLVWAWFLREVWQTFNWRYILLSVLGSFLPDIEHLFYFYGYGKKESYTREIIRLVKNRQWRMLALYISSGHKFNTNLSYHNFYFMAILSVIAAVSFMFAWQAGVLLLGAMILHYLFDMFDDWVTLGYINDNWKRWGRGKKEAS